MLPSLLAIVPVQQILYGSDWPYTPEGVVRRLAAQIDATALIDADAKALILRTNATRLIARLSRT
jgi:predicted TIM-barrel fold metal-dependent hydrolase